MYTLVDCSWSEWTIGQCSKTCGGGKRTNNRLKSVEASFGGKPCIGGPNITVPCNTEKCSGKIPKYRLDIKFKWGNIRHPKLYHYLNVLCRLKSFIVIESHYNFNAYIA